MNRLDKPDKLASIINSVLADTGYSETLLKAEIMDKWNEIVGSTVASETKCIDIVENILHVKVFSAAWRNQLLYLKKDILRKIHQKTGNDSLKDINFK